MRFNQLGRLLSVDRGQDPPAVGRACQKGPRGVESQERRYGTASGGTIPWKIGGRVKFHDEVHRKDKDYLPPMTAGHVAGVLLLLFLAAGLIGYGLGVRVPW